MADSRHLGKTAAILENPKVAIFRQRVWPIATKFGMVTHFHIYGAFDRYKFVISKTQDGSGRYVKKSKNFHIHKKKIKNIEKGKIGV